MKYWELCESEKLIEKIQVEPGDGRILPVSRMALRFIGAARANTGVRPDFADGHRVQRLIECAFESMRKSASVNFS
jgi:hypothetical protein